MFDYKEMLRKYSDHVADCEGTDFLSEKYRASLASRFTPEEIVALRLACGVNANGIGMLETTPA